MEDEVLSELDQAIFDADPANQSNLEQATEQAEREEPSTRQAEPTEAAESAEAELKAEPAENAELLASDDDEMHERVKRAHIEAREAKRRAQALQAELDVLKGNRTETRDESIHREAQQLAEQIAKQKSWNDDCNMIAAAAKKEFKDFDAVLEDYRVNFPEWGGVPQPIIEAALEEKDSAHRIVHYLGKNLDEAERIMTLSPTKQGAAIARLAAKLAQPKQVSKTPPPIRPLNGQSPAAQKSVDEMSTAEFMKHDEAETRRRFKEKYH